MEDRLLCRVTEVAVFTPDPMESLVQQRAEAAANRAARRA
jgi:hypothetical protein